MKALPEDYYEPVCVPLTKTVRLFGFTPMSLVVVVLTLMFMAKLKLYILMPLVLVGLYLHYKAIEKDSWYIDGLITHAMLVLFGQTRWGV